DLVGRLKEGGDLLLGDSVVAYSEKFGLRVPEGAVETGSTVQIVSSNDPPSLNIPNAGQPLAYRENDGFVSLLSEVEITDADGSTLELVTISLGDSYVPGEDELSLLESGITGIETQWDSAQGVLSLAGKATHAEWEQILKSVAYRNLSDAPSEQPRQLSWTIGDGSASSASVSTHVEIISVRDEPVFEPAFGDLHFHRRNGKWVVDMIDQGEVVMDSRPMPTSLGLIFPDQVPPISAAVVAGPSSLIPSSGVNLIWDGDYPTWSFEPVPGVTGEGWMQMIIQQPDGKKVTYTMSFTIEAGTEEPAMEIEGNHLVYTEDEGPRRLISRALINDDDDTHLEGATIRFVNQSYVVGEDRLVFVDTNEITGTWNEQEGVLTLQGRAEVENYATALERVAYENTNHGAPSSALRQLEWAVSDDEGGLSVPVDSTLEVIPVNDPTQVDSFPDQMLDQGDTFLFILTFEDVDSDLADLTFEVSHDADVATNIKGTKVEVLLEELEVKPNLDLRTISISGTLVSVESSAVVTMSARVGDQQNEGALGSTSFQIYCRAPGDSLDPNVLAPYSVAISQKQPHEYKEGEPMEEPTLSLTWYGNARLQVYDSIESLGDPQAMTEEVILGDVGKVQFPIDLNKEFGFYILLPVDPNQP
ncbi:MAG: hypothetical protein EBU26_12160, partial [Verrucomicrobia bacterium]|nr:hypothetical protein [Verrucomicrobiota bacterium]